MHFFSEPNTFIRKHQYEAWQGERGKARRSYEWWFHYVGPQLWFFSILVLNNGFTIFKAYKKTISLFQVSTKSSDRKYWIFRETPKGADFIAHLVQIQLEFQSLIPLSAAKTSIYLTDFQSKTTSEIQNPVDYHFFPKTPPISKPCRLSLFLSKTRICPTVHYKLVEFPLSCWRWNLYIKSFWLWYNSDMLCPPPTTWWKIKDFLLLLLFIRGLFIWDYLDSHPHR